MNDLEKEFRAAVSAANAELGVELKKAREAIAAAEAIAEKYGVPFYGPSGLAQVYRPGSYDTKWVSMEEDKLEELIEELGIDPGDYGGWQHSAVCY